MDMSVLAFAGGFFWGGGTSTYGIAECVRWMEIGEEIGLLLLPFACPAHIPWASVRATKRSEK